MPTFKLNGKNLVHFAGWKRHVGFYPVPSAIEAFKKELLEYEVAKGSVQFPLNKPMPLDLIGKIVRYRVKENEALKKRRLMKFGIRRIRWQKIQLWNRELPGIWNTPRIVLAARCLRV